MISEKQKTMLNFIKDLISYKFIDNYGYTTRDGLSLFLDKTGEEVRRIIQIYSQNGNEVSISDALSNPDNEYQILILMPTDNDFTAPVDDWRWCGDSLGMYALSQDELYTTLENYFKFLNILSSDDLTRAAAMIDDDDDFIV